MLWLSSFAVFAQDYIQQSYSIKTDKNIEYGKVEDFAGNMRSLTLDVSYPTNDSVESCGRPLILIVHGGGFVAGSKDNGSIVRMREDFAKHDDVNVRLFPNPTDPTTGFNIHTPHAPEQIIVFDLMGRVVPIEMHATENNVSCTFKQDLIRGTYMVVLDFGSARVHKRLVVN